MDNICKKKRILNKITDYFSTGNLHLWLEKITSYRAFLEQSQTEAAFKCISQNNKYYIIFNSIM